jgi:hypothetical protein
MKAALLLSLFTFMSQASILKRPEYVPDENHPAPKIAIVPRQAEEERPRLSRDDWSDQKEIRKKRAQRNQKTNNK